MTFAKPPLSIADQRLKLEARGLAVPNPTKAERYLGAIGYYRLSAYTRPFQRDLTTHEFHSGVEFDDILRLYIFDRQLRLTLLDALERVEIAVRTRINDMMCANTSNAHWHLNPSNFKDHFDHTRFLAEIGKHDDFTVRAYKDKYNSPSEPPAWMAFQTLSFGTCSMVLAHLQKRQQRDICQSFGIEPYPMTRWVHGMTILRNTAAHHSRTWDRHFIVNLPYTSQLPGTLKGTIDPTNHNTLDGYALVLDAFMQHVSPGSHWWTRLRKLVQDYHDDTPHAFHKADVQRRAAHLLTPSARVTTP